MTGNGIPVKQFKPDWLKGEDKEMAKYAYALIAVHNGKSKGTADMIKKMKSLPKRVHVVVTEG